MAPYAAPGIILKDKGKPDKNIRIYDYIGYLSESNCNPIRLM